MRLYAEQGRRVQPILWLLIATVQEVHTPSRASCPAIWNPVQNMSLAIPGHAILLLSSRDVMLFYSLVPMQWRELLMVCSVTQSLLKDGTTLGSMILWLVRVAFLPLLLAV